MIDNTFCPFFVVKKLSIISLGFFIKINFIILIDAISIKASLL